ncbi:MAG TPA: glycosyltransferase, partial [Terriglobales bacterium]|nr:glycosyltransferase [Terriglobales bacterium]
LACMWPLTVIALLARAIARENCRIVVSEHTSWSRSPLVSRSSVAWQVAASMRLFYPLANGIVAVSRGAADDLSRFSRLDRKSISAIYNPIVNQGLVEDPDCPLEPAGWCVGGHRRVLAVGRLKAIKGYETLLRSFSLLVKRVDAKLLILGEGEQREALEALAGDLGLSERVFMPGFSRNPTPYFRHAHLHVLSSSGEGFANVIVEAMAAGTPVVSTDCLSGPREILADGKFGRLVPVGDVSALAEAMEASLSVEVDEGVLKARAREFSIEVSADQYLHLLVPAADVGSTEVEEA